jgi:pyruvate formate lyase activating enzyme
MMIETDPDLLEDLGNDRIRCLVCEVRCVLKPGDRGFCQTRLHKDGKIYSLIYGTTSGVCSDPIEKKPLYHFHPGTRVLSAGTRGCNFHCPGCQNWHISHDRPGEDASNLRTFTPEQSVHSALESDCQGIAWTYNDPSIWFEHTYDTAIMAKQRGLYTVYVTNGYSTEKTLEKIAPYLDAFRVDIKGFSRKAYRHVTGLGKWEVVLERARQARELGLHVECVTNVTPTLNDSFSELADLAGWIAEDLGREVPWHVTRFQPYLDLSHLPPTPLATLERTYEIGLEAGLHHVYLGNVPGHEGQHTRCPSCGETVIERSGFAIRSATLRNGDCPHCGHHLYGIWPEKIAPSNGNLYRVAV